jgi:hypothetical protein
MMGSFKAYLVRLWETHRLLVLLGIVLGWVLFITVVHVVVNRRESLAVLMGRGGATSLEIGGLPVT